MGARLGEAGTRSADIMSRRVLITGAGGYLGSALSDRLEKSGCRPLRMVRRATGAADEIVGSVADADLWSRSLEDVDTVFHLAAHEHRHGMVEQPLQDLEINVMGTLLMLERCRQLARPPRIVFASTSNIVGSPKEQPVDETTPDDPLTAFAISKLTSELLLRHYGRTYGLSSITCRLVNVYGPSAETIAMQRSALNSMIFRALREGMIRLFGNHGCRRDYLYVDDVVDALLTAAAFADPGAGRYLIGSGTGATFDELAELIADAVQSVGRGRPSIEIDESMLLEPLAWRELIADSSRFSSLTGWLPRVGLGDGVGRTIGAISLGSN